MKKNTTPKDTKEEESIEKNIVENTEIDIEELQSELIESQNSSKESYEKLVRVQAEMENLRKRNAKDLENAHKFALDGFSRSLLEVADSISMGIKVASEKGTDIENIKKGLEMTNKVFLDTLEKYNIQQINPKNEKFNPEQHEAITMVPNPDVESNTIIDVMQVGFSLNDRVIRPAMVVVSA